MSCFVPNCSSTSGVPFPTDAGVKKQWIESLNLKCSPTDASFVCLDHFRSSDSDETAHSATESLGRIKSSSIPYAFNTADRNESETEFARKDGDADKVCRVCKATECLEKCIYDQIDGEISIMRMIMNCCYPIVITEDDDLPRFICSPCLKRLQEAHQFRLLCLKTDEMWHRTESKKRKLSDEFQSTKKVCTGVQTSPDDSDTRTCDKKGFTCGANDMKCKSICKTITKHNGIDVNCESDDEELCKDAERKTVQSNKCDHPPLVGFDGPPPLVPIERKCSQLPARSKLSSGYDETERSLEEMHNTADETTDSEVKLENAKLVKITRSKGDIKATSVEISKTLVKTHSKPATKAVHIVNIPKGITVVSADAYESPKGTFPCSLTYGLQESVFILADEYLFTCGLLKGHIRYLHCVLPSCKASASQKLLKDGTYVNFIHVKVAHNHQAPTEQVRKKQMFFHVMRKRIQLDKTLNIRSIYEEVCSMEPEIRTLVPLRNVINEICRYQVSNRLPQVKSFRDFYNRIEDEAFEKLHFTNSSHQFYQERFAADDGSLAVVFCNTEIIGQVSDSTIMYVDASFKIDTNEQFKYQLVTVLVWIDDSYYPILFALADKKTREIFKKIFTHLHDVLAPNLRPHEIVTDYEACLYYALGETYLDSHIGGSVFYYTQNLYKKVCSLNLSRDLEVNSNFRNIYHMLLMLPLLPVNTILDGLNNIEVQARDVGLSELAQPVFDHIKTQWILNVTPELFCVHRLENRINENVIAPFKKLRDFLLLFKGKTSQSQITVAQVVEKLIELESFLNGMYTKIDKKSFGRDLSSFQKKNVVRAWQFIESHPKININSFFQKVLGYIKCMENQLWIWGFYRYAGAIDDVLINASSFSIVSGSEEFVENDGIVPLGDDFFNDVASPMDDDPEHSDPLIIMEAVIDNDGGVLLQADETSDPKQFEKSFLKYVQYE